MTELHHITSIIFKGCLDMVDSDWVKKLHELHENSSGWVATRLLDGYVDLFKNIEARADICPACMVYVMEDWEILQNKLDQISIVR